MSSHLLRMVGPYCWEYGLAWSFGGFRILAFQVCVAAVASSDGQLCPILFLSCANRTPCLYCRASVAPGSEANHSTSRIKVKLCSVSVPRVGRRPQKMLPPAVARNVLYFVLAAIQVTSTT